nr:uncharacterized protein LOC103693048 isoform X4 [Rattus norvegicus]|eukprot:XP_017451499.1 PREDICTED: uncharacterized protein LOC103690606 isoform X1 [Rattus norvegicus]
MYSRLRKHFGRVNGDFGQTRVRESRLSSKTNDGQRKLAWGMRKDGRLTSSPGPVVINKEANTEEQRLIRQLQSATEERNELRDLLTYVTERYRNNRVCRYVRSNPFYEKLKIKEREVMSLLHNLEMRNIEHCEKFQELQKEINFYRLALIREAINVLFPQVPSFVLIGGLQRWFRLLCSLNITVPWVFWTQFLGPQETGTHTQSV